MNMKAEEIRILSIEGLQDLLKDKQSELMQLKGKKEMGYNIPKIKTVRKDIARIKTIIREKRE